MHRSSSKTQIRRQARTSVVITRPDTHMILEALPVCVPGPHAGQPTQRDYAEAFPWRTARFRGALPRKRPGAVARPSTHRHTPRTASPRTSECAPPSTETAGPPSSRCRSPTNARSPCPGCRTRTPPPASRSSTDNRILYGWGHFDHLDHLDHLDRGCSHTLKNDPVPRANESRATVHRLLTTDADDLLTGGSPGGI